MTNLSINPIQNKPLKQAGKIAKVSIPVLLAGLTLRPQLHKDTLEISNLQNLSRSRFITQFINNKEVENTIKTHDFTQYGNNGIPLVYSREKFTEDMENTLQDMPEEEQYQSLSKYNLRYGYDIDGIANIKEKKPETPEEAKIQTYITKFYNNQVKVNDLSVNKAISTLIEGMPEFTMTIGKQQHKTHVYSVDIHTLLVLQKCLNNPEYENLSEKDKEVLKLSVLMHDFGKDGYIVTQGHASQSKKDAEMILKSYSIDPQTKERVLKQVENHHWFEKYNKGITKPADVKNIFGTPEDLAVAKIMAKADLESISPTFHREILDYGNSLTQKQFDKLFKKKIDKIKF